MNVTVSQWLFRCLAISLAVLILYLSLQPGGGEATIPHADKVGHFLAYASLSALAALGWPQWRGVTIIIGATIFGIGIEFAQGLIGQGRTFSVLDMLANLAGAAFAIVIILRLRAR